MTDGKGDTEQKEIYGLWLRIENEIRIVLG